MSRPSRKATVSSEQFNEQTSFYLLRTEFLPSKIHFLTITTIHEPSKKCLTHQFLPYILATKLAE